MILLLKERNKKGCFVDDVFEATSYMNTHYNNRIFHRLSILIFV